MSGAAPLVRPVAHGDFPVLQGIYAHYVRHGLGSFELEPPDLASFAERARTLVDQGYPYSVAELEGAVRGYAYAGPYRPRPAYRFALEVSVYVDPGHQRRGLGVALLRALIERATGLGYRRMVAVIGDSANQGSIGLHQAEGFAMVGVIPAVGFKLGRWVDVVILQRSLGDGATSLPPPGA